MHISDILCITRIIIIQWSNRFSNLFNSKIYTRIVRFTPNKRRWFHWKIVYEVYYNSLYLAGYNLCWWKNLKIYQEEFKMKTKMNKRIRLTSLILCFTLLLSVSTYAAESTPDIVSQDIQNNLVDVVLDSSDERYIVVSVPQDKAEEYKNQIETVLSVPRSFLRPTWDHRP